MSLERWKPIAGYENYSVSSWGRVRNNLTGDILQQERHDKGYLRVDLYGKRGERKHLKVHRLVAEAFIPNTEKKPCVNHIDGNNKNNSISNLEWVTDKENKEKARKLRAETP